MTNEAFLEKWEEGAWENVSVTWHFGFDDVGNPVILYRIEKKDLYIIQQITPNNAKKLAKMLETLILTDWVKQKEEKMKTIADVEMMFKSKFGHNNG
jgi:tRNA A37 N6-isopentenylltransferase MiaA